MDHWSRRQFVQGVGIAGLGVLAGTRVYRSKIASSAAAGMPIPQSWIQTRASRPRRMTGSS